MAPNEADWHGWLMTSLSDTGVTRPSARRVTSIVLLGLGTLLLIAAIGTGFRFLIDGWSYVLQNGGSGSAGILGMSFATLLWPAISLTLLAPLKLAVGRRFMQRRARTAEQELERATGARRPVLYLRSFAFDEALSKLSLFDRIASAIIPILRPPTAEELLSKRLRKLGPLIAIGRPGEELPALGAARFYVSHDRWQQKVADVVSVAQLVVWASGTTPGLRWEISHLIRSLPPEKLVVWAHPHLLSLGRRGREAEWQRFLAALGDVFPKPLPEVLGRVRFIEFGEGYEPHPVAPNEYALGELQNDALRAVLAGKGLRRRVGPRSSNPFVRLAIGFAAGLLAWASATLLFDATGVTHLVPTYFNVANFSLYDFVDVARERPWLVQVHLFDILRSAEMFGAAGVAFVLLQPLLPRWPGGYRLWMIPLGILLYFLLVFFAVPVVPGQRTFLELWEQTGLSPARAPPVLWLLPGAVWGALTVVYLRLLPGASGRPPPRLRRGPMPDAASRAATPSGARRRRLAPALGAAFVIVSAAAWVAAATAGNPRMLAGHRGWVRSLAFSPTASLVASASADGTVKLWDPATGMLVRTITGYSDAVTAVAFSPDGKMLAAGSLDDTIRFWDAATGNAIATFTGHAGEERGSSDSVLSLAFSPDGLTLASGRSDNTILLWDVYGGKPPRRLSGHAGFVWSVAFSPDGRQLASASDDKTIKLWNPESGEELRTLDNQGKEAQAVAFSPDGRLLASGESGYGEDAVDIRDAASGDVLRALRGHIDSVFALVFSPDGRVLASGSDDKTIRLWDAATGNLLETLAQRDGGSGVTALAFSTDGGTLASGGRDAIVRLWRPQPPR